MKRKLANSCVEGWLYDNWNNLEWRTVMSLAKKRVNAVKNKIANFRWKWKEYSAFGDLSDHIPNDPPQKIKCSFCGGKLTPLSSSIRLEVNEVLDENGNNVSISDRYEISEILKKLVDRLVGWACSNCADRQANLVSDLEGLLSSAPSLEALVKKLEKPKILRLVRSGKPLLYSRREFRRKVV